MGTSRAHRVAFRFQIFLVRNLYRVETLPWTIHEAEAVGLEPTTVFDRSCFQDSVLIRPGDFRSCVSKRSDVSGNRTRGLLDENQTILPSESTTPFC